MLSRLRARLTYANVVATLALFIALGGSSYAALSLPKNSVGSKQLKANSVTSAKVKLGSLRADDFKCSVRSSLRGSRGPRGAAGRDRQGRQDGQDGQDRQDRQDGGHAAPRARRAPGRPSRPTPASRRSSPRCTRASPSGAWPAPSTGIYCLAAPLLTSGSAPRPSCPSATSAAGYLAGTACAPPESRCARGTRPTRRSTTSTSTCWSPSAGWPDHTQGAWSPDPAGRSLDPCTSP